MSGFGEDSLKPHHTSLNPTEPLFKHIFLILSTPTLRLCQSPTPPLYQPPQSPNLGGLLWAGGTPPDPRQEVSWTSFPAVYLGPKQKPTARRGRFHYWLPPTQVANYGLRIIAPTLVMSLFNYLVFVVLDQGITRRAPEFVVLVVHKTIVI